MNIKCRVGYRSNSQMTNIVSLPFGLLRMNLESVAHYNFANFNIIKILNSNTI